MKKLSALCLLLSLLLLVQVVVLPVFATDVPEDTTAPDASNSTPIGPAIAPQGQPLTVTDSDASVSHGCNSIDAQVPLGGSQKLLKTARAAILFELNSGTLLYSYNPDARMEPAGLVKILTSLIVLEQGNLEREVTVTQTALDTVPSGSIDIDLCAGEVLTMEELLHGAMVGSGNDACAVIAETVSGSQEAFASLMNQRAKEIGCTASNFTNAHGLSDEEQYTTARDMGRILVFALQNEQFRELFGKTSYWIEKTEFSDSRYLMTSNYFMSKETGIVKFYDTRVTGGRTGSISNDDRSMACTAVSGDLNLMSIVMGCQAEFEADGYSLHRMGNFEETLDLLEWGFKYFSVNQVLNIGRSLSQLPVSNGSNHVTVRSVQSVDSAIPYGTTGDDLVWKYLLEDGSLTAPVQKDAIVGTVQVWFGSICLAQSDMITMNTSVVDTNLLDPGEDLQGGQTEKSGLGIFLQGLGMVFAVIVVIIILFIALRLIRGAIIRARRRRRRMNRRRSH